MRFLAILVLVACGKGDAPAPPPALDNLHATLDGKRIYFDRAFIKTVSPGVWTVLVGAGKGSCEALVAGTNAGKGQAFAFTVTKRVGPAGNEAHVLTDLWSRDFDATLPTGEKVAILDEQIAKDRPTRIILPPSTGTRFAITKGQLTAIGCAAPPPTGAGVPAVAHPSKATILVAGNKLAVRGVTVSGTAQSPNITISTGPRDCSNVEMPAEIVLKRQSGAWSLAGTWIERPIEGSDGLTFSASDVGKTADGPTLLLQLGGKAKFGDYTVELFGTVEAIECT